MESKRAIIQAEKISLCHCEPRRGEAISGLSQSKRAFSTLEYAVLTVVVIAALITMSIYIKRAVSGRFKDTADSFGFGRQYDPDHTDQKCYDKNGDPTACP